MDPAKFIAYANALASEIEALAIAGNRQLVAIELSSGKAAALLAVGDAEAELLQRLMNKFEADPDMIAFRAQRKTAVQTEVVGALDPARN